VKIKFQADANLNEDIVNGVLRRIPEIDFQTAHEANLHRASDPEVLTIAAGASKLSLGPFLLASIVSRAMRFYLEAALLFWFGEPVRDFIERRLNLLTTFLVLLIGGFVAIKYMF